MQSAKDFSTALSPIREVAAYEALWNTPDASVKKIAEAIKYHQQSLLSLIVDPELINNYLDQIRKIIKPMIPQFGVCFLGETDYPEKLLDAKYPVPLLYYMGAWDLIYSPSVSVVGTRSPTSEGIRRTQKLVKELVKEGYTIISGLAKGIQSWYDRAL